MSLEIHVVSHTHWDREWYHLASRFRQGLVALIDDLLDDPPQAPASFLLDGQTILIEDYLAVRPERAAELSALLRDGRLEAGPWFVLADELIPSGESLVRNLLAGRRTLERLRAKAPPVLYCPDSFGHPAALPEIAVGFGIDLIILWRGFGGRSFPPTDVAWWSAPSGVETLLYHLPPDGYEIGSALPIDAVEAARRWERLQRDLVARSSTTVALLPNGADHHARQPALESALLQLADAAAPARLQAGSMRSFSAALQQVAPGARPPSISGELRDSYGYTWTLQGTFGTRAAQKRRNAQCERSLVRDCEPWLALARLGAALPAHDVRPDTNQSRLSALTHIAWRTLLECHPHDTLCGCAIDGVARAMDHRMDEVEAQAAGLRAESIQLLLGQDPAAAREDPSHWRSTLLVRNPAPRLRGGVAIVELLEKSADVPVGPRSAGARIDPAKPRTPSIPGVELQFLSSEVVFDRLESPLHYPDNDLVTRWTAAAWIADVPPYGLRAIPHSANPDDHGPAAHRHVRDVVATDETISNGLLAVQLVGGKLRLSELSSGRIVGDLLAVEDAPDLGDSYTPSIRGELRIATLVGSRLTHRGPLLGEMLTWWSFGDDEQPLEISLALCAGSPLLRVRITGENTRQDHRMRLRFDTGLGTDVSFADAAFGPVRRHRHAPPRRPGVHRGSDEPEYRLVEMPPPTDPLHRFVSLHSRDGGTTLYSDGLAEYELQPDGKICVTLIRAIGELSRNDLPERPGHAGWPASIPEAQSLGPFEAGFALMLHDGERTPELVDRIERCADDFLVPLTGHTLRHAIDPPAEVTGFALEGTGLAFSTAKVSDDGAWVVLRCVNLLDVTVTGAWILPRDLLEARLSRLDETPGEAAHFSGRRLQFDAAPRQVITILVR